MENNILHVSEYAKLKVYWDDKPEDYSREAKLKIRNYFAKKYGVDKYAINVIYTPVRIGEDGEVIQITGAGVDNIMDLNYQVELMKTWYKREGKTVNFDRLMDLDKKVNGSLNIDHEVASHRSWDLKWLFIDNFLCFGEKNYVSFSRLRGLNVVNSIPENQGGKTTLTVDAIKFLLYGRTTKTDKNEQIFNTYTENNNLTLRGMLVIDGEELIIERKLHRTAKRDGGWTVISKVKYYRILPDGEEEAHNEEDSKITTQKIAKNIGSEKDFDITILATGRNLEDLIEAKPTESGRLLTKFIGLEIIETKEAIVKDMISKFNKTKKGNHYDIVSLLTDNETQARNLTLYTAALEQNNINLDESVKRLEKLEEDKETQLNGKLNVDVVISQLNPENIEKEIDRVTNEGLEYKKKITILDSQIKELKGASYDEDFYRKLLTDNTTLSVKINTVNNEIDRLGKVIDSLKNDEICQTCNRPLDDVDHSAKIRENEGILVAKKNELVELTKSHEDVNSKITQIDVDRLLVDKRNRLELEKDKHEVEIGLLRNLHTSKSADLKKYKENEAAIKRNLEIDLEVAAIKTNIVVETKTKDDINQKIYTTKTEIKNIEDKLISNNEMIEILKKEEAYEKIFKVYVEMVGKKGISKLVLRSVLPIINSELQRLLDDVCNFEVELNMNDKNEVEYLLIKSGVEKALKSGSGLERTIASLALRCVLSRISHLPMPNFITFDEILGKVAAINIEKLRPMFEKIKNMFEMVFFITHNDLVKDWGDNIITVRKDNDISKININ